MGSPFKTLLIGGSVLRVLRLPLLLSKFFHRNLKPSPEPFSRPIKELHRDVRRKKRMRVYVSNHLGISHFLGSYSLCSLFSVQCAIEMSWFLTHRACILHPFYISNTSVLSIYFYHSLFVLWHSGSVGKKPPLPCKLNSSLLYTSRDQSNLAIA